uniref:lysoplasmalogenase n=1 Tax=Steinernema glaseri TaxID=37863 RepID=A0A1I7ZWS5_9BILA
MTFPGSKTTFLFLTAVPYTFLVGLFYFQTDGFDFSSSGYSVWKPSAKLTAGVVLFGAVMNHACLKPYVGEYPVSSLVMLLYSVLLSSTVIISGSMWLKGSTDQKAGHQENKIRFAGFALFAFSDSLLLLEHSDLVVLPFSPLFILGTYFVAQFAILSFALFAFSDSLLLLEHSDLVVLPFSPLLILGTYFAAQFVILSAACVAADRAVPSTPFASCVSRKKLK